MKLEEIEKARKSLNAALRTVDVRGDVVGHDPACAHLSVHFAAIYGPRLLALAERVEASPVGDVGIDDGDLVFVRVPDGVNRPNFQGQPVRLLVVEGGE